MFTSRLSDGFMLRTFIANVCGHVVISVIPRFLWCESVNFVFFSSSFELERITKGMKKIHFPSIYGLKFVTKHNNTGYNTFYDSQRFCANKYHRRQKKIHHQEMLIQSMLIASAPWIIVNIKNICFSKSQKKNARISEHSRFFCSRLNIQCVLRSIRRIHKPLILFLAL